LQFHHLLAADRAAKVFWDQNGRCSLQLEDFSFEEISQVLWVAARISQQGSVHPLTYTALRVWPRKLQQAAQHPEKSRRPSPKNLAQLAFAYGKPPSVFTRSDVSTLCHFAHLFALKFCLWNMNAALRSPLGEQGNLGTHSNFRSRA
jgi:hypothetical protein